MSISLKNFFNPKVRIILTRNKSHTATNLIAKRISPSHHHTHNCLHELIPASHRQCDKELMHHPHTKFTWQNEYLVLPSLDLESV